MDAMTRTKGGNMHRLVLATSGVAIVLLAAGCMSGNKSDRSARKAALGSTTSGEVIGSMDISGVASGIDLYSFSWGAESNSGGQHTNQFAITKKIDPVSTTLLHHALIAQVFPSVTIRLLPVGGRPYATYDLTNAVVQQVDHGAGNGDEQVALQGTCVAFTPTGGTRFGWDNARQRTC